MTLKSLLSHSIEAYTAVRSDARPADAILSDYLRTRKYLGSHDRKFISEAVYGTLRYDLAIEPVVANRFPEHSNKFIYSLIIFLFLSKQHADDLLSPTTELTSLSREQLLDLRSHFFSKQQAPCSISERYAFPEWVTEKLLEEFSEEELAHLYAALNTEAPLTLRTNTLLTSRTALQQALADEHIITTFGHLSPDALICERRRPIFQSHSYRKGLCEIQDEGSQLISLLLNPKPKTITLDACAGGGGKTLHLATLMQNKGKVYAYEKFPKRFGNIRDRLKRSTLQNVELLDSDDKLQRFREKFSGKVDYILIDAPCTGSGTLRRNPDLKRRLTPESLERLKNVQSEILDDYAPLLKVGGRLVYATCSIFREENEAQIDAFLLRHPYFSRLPVSEVVKEIRIDADLTRLCERLQHETYLKLFPHRDNTDGFFAAVLTRRS
ncbi:MAG: RsmB/NOP family class I SAM-dependent RNA methyltransferase [Chloroherpetonaceae bacterium]